MFDHPIFKSRVLGVGYAVIWFSILILNSALEYFYGSTPLPEVFFCNLVFSTVFAVLAIPLWYPVNSFRKYHDGDWIMIVFHHMATAAIFIMIWFSISYHIVIYLFPNGKSATIPLEEQLSFGIFQGIMGYVIVILSYYLHLYSRNLREKHD